MRDLPVLSVMARRFALPIMIAAFVAACSGSVAPAAVPSTRTVAPPPPAGAPPAPRASGTVKIHDGNGESGGNANDPKVCTFHLHFFFGAGSSGTWRIATQPGGGQVMNGTWSSGEAEDVRVPEAPDLFSLPDGQYKLYWTQDGVNGQKQKVFKVECAAPTGAPVPTPTPAPTATPTPTPTPSPAPTATPSAAPTAAPTAKPTAAPTTTPAVSPTPTAPSVPTPAPTATPTAAPTASPTVAPTARPTPTTSPAATATPAPTASSIIAPTQGPAETAAPTAAPTTSPTAPPTPRPTASPAPKPTPTPKPSGGVGGETGGTVTPAPGGGTAPDTATESAAAGTDADEPSKVALVLLLTAWLVGLLLAQRRLSAGR